MTDNFEVDMQEDFTQAYDARAIKRLIDNGEPLSTSADSCLIGFLIQHCFVHF